MTAIREATATVIELSGFEILSDSHRFVASMLDLLDYRMPERDVLVKWGDEQLLGPLAKAADLGAASEFETAYSRGVWYLHDRNGVITEVAQSLMHGMTMGVADVRGVYVTLPEPERPKELRVQPRSVPPRKPSRPHVNSNPTHEYDTPAYGRNAAYVQSAQQPVIQSTPQSVPQSISQSVPQQQVPAPKRTNFALLVVVVVLLGAIAAVGTFVLIPRLLHSDGTSQVEVDPGINGGGGDDSTDGTDSGEEPEVRSSLSAYSWAELGEISQLMKDAGSRNAAIDVAEQYNLVQGGRFVSDTKAVKLSDGTTLNMRLVDIMHDDLASGSGQASMTFLAANVSHHGRMAPATTTDGGWESSEMRSWMSSTLYNQLPSEVSGLVVPVSKYSNNVGKTRSTSCVTSTTDYLWLPSIVELCGPVNWSYSSDESNSAYYNSVFNAEGSQFAYYSQQAIQKADDNNRNDCLALGEIWWMRSTAASRGRGRYVTAAGDPSKYGDSNDSHGVVVGFCI